MIKVLFICHGNICRSPMAQYVMQDLVNKAGLSKHFIIDSAATSTEEIGNGVHYGTRQKLREVGVPCGDHRAVQITKKDYNIYDYLIVMDTNNLRNLKRIIPNDPDAKVSMLLDYANRQGQSIADPWYTGNFDATYRDVLEGCQGLLEYLRDRGMV
ncbi:MAG: low molecular weight phosphotyrosine protein phosphatase [Lachnospira sp.]|nr:low molecular weight phosphotyrosine protein phosphatase [Lachnospira sp.]